MATRVPGKSPREYEKIRDILRYLLKNSRFQGMVSKETDLENMFMALMRKESSMRPDNTGPDTSGTTPGNAAGRFLLHPKVVQVTKLNDVNLTANINECTKAYGLAQSMGYNHVRGISPWSSTTQCEIERLVLKYGFDASWAVRLTINPGDSIGKVMGVNGKEFTDDILTNQIMSGLIILNDKWHNVLRYKDGVRWYRSFNGTEYINHSRLLVAMGSYLGYGGKDKVGSTAAGYVASIVGPNYREANGFGSNLVSSSFEILTNGAPARVSLTETTRKALGCTA